MVNGKLNSVDIVNGINAGLSIIDNNFRIVWINKVQSAWFGPPKEVCGRKCYQAYKGTNEICKDCPTLKVFQTGKPQTGISIVPGKNGRKVHYFLSVTPVKDKYEKTRFAVELVQDITEKVKEDKKITVINRSLKRMYSHLASVNKKLCSSVNRLKELTNNVIKNKYIMEKKYKKSKNKLSSVQEELQGIIKVNRSLNSNNDSKRTTLLITKSICELMNTDSCVLSILNEDNHSLSAHSVYGLRESGMKGLPAIKLGEGIIGSVALTKKPFVSSDIYADKRIKYSDRNTFKIYDTLSKEAGLKSIIAVPVMLHNKVLGVVSAYSKRKRYFKEDEIEILTIFASQVAIAVEEAKYNENIHKNYFNTMHALVLAIEARDPYTRGHTDRVTKYSLQFARAIKMGEQDIEILRYASEVHDVGKISIPDFILNKPGKLTSGERAMVELHPVKGAEMLEPLDFLKPAIPIVRHHHERFDGTGYPDGLERDKIPFFSRIIACADAFDAMTSDRPYRKNKMTTEEAVAEIKNNSGSQFDPHIAQIFVKIICNSNA